MPKKQIGSFIHSGDADYDDEKEYASHNVVQGPANEATKKLRSDFGDAKVMQEHNPRLGPTDKFCILLRDQTYFRDFRPDWGRNRAFTRFYSERRLLLDVGSLSLPEQKARLGLCTAHGFAYICVRSDIDDDEFLRITQRAVQYARKYAEVSQKVTVLPGVKLSTGEYAGVQVPVIRRDFDGRLVGMEQPEVFIKKVDQIVGSK